MRPLTIGFIVAVAVAAGIALAVQEWSPGSGCSREPAPGVDWSGCNRQALDLRNEGLGGMIFAEADIARSALAGADLRAADFTRARVDRVVFDGADLREALFDRAEGPRASFRNADLSGANLGKAILPRGDFAGAVLARAQLAKADLQRSDLQQANLEGADLSETMLARADLRDARLAGTVLARAYLMMADLRGLDLSAAEGLTTTQLAEACGDAETRLPAGVERPDTWPCPALEPATAGSREGED
ncbi:pentapeptide repeat-containing protein [Algihabitans albus]|uniref:pentapeptide repeat-containing protein n=1 Tax=Algihabitans albus TaxID=2164067 RepID=UPI000E5D4291|nr:pentapeptide repeat-containing protein [Algihabitans albus]